MKSEKKSVIRRQMRSWRRSLDERTRKKAACGLAERLLSIGALGHRRKVALYWPDDGEIDVRWSITLHLSFKGEVYLPHIVHKKSPALFFLRWSPVMAVRPNRYQIPEPASGQLIKAQQLDSIIVPLVAFNSQCQRLGMGGGFYDSTLRARTHQCLYSRPKLIGVAFEGQRNDALKVDDWDVPLDHICTENFCYDRPS